MNQASASYIRIGIIGVLTLFAGSAIWWQTSYSGPEQAFNDMLNNNLTTTSVTKKTTQDSSDTKVTQRIQLQLGSTNASRWYSRVETRNSSAVTESIGTKDAGYVRYTMVEPSPKAGRQLINVWAKSSAQNSELKNLFASSLLDITSAPVPPLGMVAEPARTKLLTFARTEDVFRPNFSKVTSTTINGRRAYNVPVEVKLAPYIQLMQGFAHVYGLKDIDSLNPATYKSAEPIKITVSVDALSHRMLRVTYPTTGYDVQYSDYGINHTITTPKRTVSEAELLQRLTVVQ
jgi:hypothetical protein